jgi:hypothetical protein
MAARHHDQGVAVGREIRDRLRGNHATGAGTVLHDDGLPPLLGDDIAERARQDIDATTGGIGHENMHGPGRKRRLGEGAAAHECMAAAATWMIAAAAAIRNHLPMASPPMAPLRYFSCYLTSSHAL